MPPAELFPPVAYSAGWLVAGIVAIVLVVLWPVAVVVITRPRRTAPGPVSTGPPPVDQRAHTLEELAAIRHRWESGSLTTRQAHQEISRVVRGYVASAGHPGVETMTLAELRSASAQSDGAQSDGAQSARLGPVADLVELLYPPEFGAGTDAADSSADETATHPAQVTTVLRRDPATAFDRAAEVVRQWS